MAESDRKPNSRQELKQAKAEARRAKAAERRAKAAAARAAAREKLHAAEKVQLARPITGFMEFIRQQGVVGLAIGLALGVQVKALVDQIVASFINPVAGLFLPGQGDLSKKTFALTLNEKTAVFTYGSFLNVLISFMAVAAVIYFVVKGLKLDKIDKASAQPVRLPPAPTPAPAPKPPQQ